MDTQLIRQRTDCQLLLLLYFCKDNTYFTKIINIKVCLVTILKVLKIKRQLNILNASYLFTQISYLEKTCTTTAREPSLYNSYIEGAIARAVAVVSTIHFHCFSCHFRIVEYTLRSRFQVPSMDLHPREKFSYFLFTLWKLEHFQTANKRGERR